MTPLVKATLTESPTNPVTSSFHIDELLGSIYEEMVDNSLQHQAKFNGVELCPFRFGLA